MDNQPYMIIGSKVENQDEQNLSGLKIRVDDESRKHDYLLHYCSADTLMKIFSNKTFKCSRLNNVELNDQFEAKRKNIEHLANGRYITCFSHCQHEIVPFWQNYGGIDKKNKVLLRFKNFCDHLADVIETDYCLLPNGMKMYFNGFEYGRTVNNNGWMGNLVGRAPINTDFDTRAYIDILSLLDIVYLPINDVVFTQDYLSFIDLTVGNGCVIKDVPTYKPQNLGKNKTVHWSYEQETRLMCTLNIQDLKEYDYFYLRLHECIFADMDIVISPWCEETLADDMRNLLNKSSLSDSVKSSITISLSELNGQIR